MRALLFVAAIVGMLIAAWLGTRINSRAEADEELRRLVDAEVELILDKIDQSDSGFEGAIPFAEYRRKLDLIHSEMKVLEREWGVDISLLHTSQLRKKAAAKRLVEASKSGRE